MLEIHPHNWLNPVALRILSLMETRISPIRSLERCGGHRADTMDENGGRQIGGQFG